MLIHLCINNIILVENASIQFLEGLNVITGETGAGKSAMLQALRLLCGEKFDQSVLRHGSPKGWAEASFEIDYTQPLIDLLEKAGISCDVEEPLILRREIASNGKSRCFINNQLAQKGILQETASFLLHIVGQHASRELLQPDNHRQIVDRYGNLSDKAYEFSQLWQQEKRLQKQLDELISSEKERLRTIETLQREVEELTQANLKEGEEEELFAEYSLLMNAETLTQTCQEALNIFQSDQRGILVQLSKAKKNLEKLVSLDGQLEETLQSTQNAEIEIQEIAFTLSHYLAKLEHNPGRAAKADERLSELNQLKRRYGNDVPTMIAYLEEAQARLHSLENSDAAIEELQVKLADIKEKLNRISKELSSARQKYASELSIFLTQELRSLNMPQVEVTLQVEPCPRNQGGDDAIEILLKPNVGEKTIPLRQCASGGELSRVLLSVQYLLSGKGGVPTLFFDEIDANIGGETASMVGKKLRAIGDRQQVVCITHFPQVASQAHHHLRIEKNEKNGRTHTTVDSLGKDQIENELLRMSGGRNNS